MIKAYVSVSEMLSFKYLIIDILILKAFEYNSIFIFLFSNTYF